MSSDGNVVLVYTIYVAVAVGKSESDCAYCDDVQTRRSA